MKWARRPFAPAGRLPRGVGVRNVQAVSPHSYWNSSSMSPVEPRVSGVDQPSAETVQKLMYGKVRTVQISSSKRLLIAVSRQNM